MANEQMITIRGRLTDDAELRFTGSGTAVANFTIAANARTFDKQTNEWKDKETVFWRCSAWRELAENIVESLQKGMAVVALAELEARSYETKEGEKRTVTEARIEAIGPDLRWATARVTKAQRNNNAGGFNQAPQQSQQQWGGQQQAAPADDPWGAPAGGQQQAWGNGPVSNDPPF